MDIKKYAKSRNWLYAKAHKKIYVSVNILD